MTDQEEHIHRRLVQDGGGRLLLLASKTGARFRLVEKAQHDPRTPPDIDLAASFEAHCHGLDKWTLTVRRQPHRTEGMAVRRHSSIAMLPEGRLGEAGDAVMKRLIDPVARLHRRDRDLKAAGYDLGAPPAWSYTMHRAALLILRHHEVDLRSAGVPATHVTDTQMQQWPSKDEKGIQSKLIGTRRGDLELVDLLMKGMRIEARTIDVRKDGRPFIEIEQAGPNTQVVIHDHNMPETILQALAGRDLSAIGHPAFGGRVGVLIKEAANFDSRVIVRMADVQDPVMPAPCGMDVSWLRA